MTLYHRTTRSIARLILRSGFVNRANRFSSDFGPEGVWFSDQPPNDIDRESDDAVISVALKLSAKALSAFERPTKAGYREWLIPTKVVSESVTAVEICSGEAPQAPCCRTATPRRASAGRSAPCPRASAAQGA